MLLCFRKRRVSLIQVAMAIFAEEKFFSNESWLTESQTTQLTRWKKKGNGKMMTLNLQLRKPENWVKRITDNGWKTW